MFNKDQENESGGIDLKYLPKLDILSLVAYVLAWLDFLTTTYGISQALDLRGIKAIVMSFVLAGIFVWVVIISKDKVAPAIEKLIGDPIRNIPVRTEQRQILNFIATVIPPIIVVLFGAIFLIIDFYFFLCRCCYCIAVSSHLVFDFDKSICAFAQASVVKSTTMAYSAKI